MIIECFGIPGAGKTTVTRLLEEKIGAKTVPKQVSKLYGLMFILKHPVFISRWCLLFLQTTRETKSWSMFRFKISVFFNTIGRIQYANITYKTNDIVALDEGLIQRFFSIYESNQTMDKYHSLLKYVPKNHIIINISYIGTDFTESRVGTYRTALGSEYAQSWRDVMAHNYKTITKAINCSKICSFLYTRTEDDVQFPELCSRIKTYVM